MPRPSDAHDGIERMLLRAGLVGFALALAAGIWLAAPLLAGLA